MVASGKIFKEGRCTVVGGLVFYLFSRNMNAIVVFKWHTYTFPHSNAYVQSDTKTWDGQLIIILIELNCELLHWNVCTGSWPRPLGTQQFSNDEIRGEDSSINATFIIDFGGEYAPAVGL